MAAYRAEIRPVLRRAHKLDHAVSGEWRLVLPRGQVVLAVAGPGANNARNTARRLVSSHQLSGLVSLGFAGGLSKTTTVGSLVVAQEVIESESGQFHPCAPDLLEHIRAERGAILTIPAVAASRAEKSRLFSRWNAVATDMEAAAVAQIAMESGLRFGALKAITDGVDDELAIDFRRCLKENRELSSVRIVLEGLKGPAQFRTLLLLARNSRLAAYRLAEALMVPQSHL